MKVSWLWNEWCISGIFFISFHFGRWVSEDDSLQPLILWSGPSTKWKHSALCSKSRKKVMLKVLNYKTFSFLLQSAFPLSLTLSLSPLLPPPECHGVFICYLMLDSLQHRDIHGGGMQTPIGAPWLGVQMNPWFLGSPCH